MYMYHVHDCLYSVGNKTTTTCNTCPALAGPVRSHGDPLTVCEFSFILCYFILFFFFRIDKKIFQLIFWIFSYYKW